MEYKLVQINKTMGRMEFEMFKETPMIENSIINEFYLMEYEEFLDIMALLIKKEKDFPEIETYILYFNDYPIGRVTINYKISDDIEKQNGHIGYFIRPSERNKKHGHMALKLGLEKLKEHGFVTVQVHVQASNLISKAIICKNGGELFATLKEKECYEIKL